ncbi:MAG: CBS domain-containing protein [Thermoplasmata archaeon]|jgi:signal-transduction protein with cAMP-binding, CBS, and nucleotidyltransferase domain|nr:CBS domain-containing protein [Thermoplasmata archaeon]
MVLLARDIMDSQVLTVPGSSDALSCAQIMVARRKGYAVVQAPVGTAVGIVTEWDFLEKVLAAGRDPSRVLVADLASPIVRPCTPETPAEDVVAVMASEGIRRMIVRSGDQVVGIITSRDVLAMFRQYVDKLSSEIAGYHSDPSPLG